ncbi:MAG: DNA repair protein RadC [Armatimonadota bacterium]
MTIAATIRYFPDALENSPRHKLASQGPGMLSPVELLAVVLSKDGEDGTATLHLARELLQSAYSIRGLSNLSPTTLRELGLSETDVYRFKAAFELGRRADRAGLGDRHACNKPEDVVQLFGFLADEKREHFCCVLLDTKNQVMNWLTVHIGTVSSSVVGVREFFRPALQQGATSVIAVHNHPSGNPAPSQEDIEVTRALAEAGKILEVPLLDHVIIGTTEDFVSLHRLGYIG